MQSAHVVILFILMAAVSARQDSGKEVQSDLNAIDTENRHPKRKRISRSIFGMNFGFNHQDVEAELNHAEHTADETEERPEDVSETSRTFFGTHPQKLEQLSDLLSLKSQVERKAANCNLRNVCEHWSQKEFLVRHVEYVKPLLQILLLWKNTYLGAVANGWLGNECTELYVACDDFIRVETSLDSSGDSAKPATISEPSGDKKLEY